MSSRSSSASFEVAWRSTASARSSRGHAAAVVADPDQPPAAAVGDDLDPRRAGVERVLDQFLDHARRPLDHLAGGDAVDDGFAELADGHWDLSHGRRRNRQRADSRCPTLSVRAAFREVLYSFVHGLIRKPVPTFRDHALRRPREPDVVVDHRGRPDRNLSRIGQIELHELDLVLHTLRRKSSNTWIVSCSPGQRR